ncbi:hypothetical protein FPV67DRAFT_1673474 [Lyophyllum atratum]|nr:hypothetical protein FPV67DRAFT_1673474 [Lyophyllum atratum]
MTPDERAILHRKGLVFLYNLENTITVTVFYGMFTLLFAISTFTLIQRGLKSRATQVMLVTTVLSFLLSTSRWIVFVTFYAMQIKGILIDSAGVLNQDTLNRVVEQGAPIRLTVQKWEPHLVTIISDGVVIWRTWVLFPDQIWVKLATLALFFGTVSTALGYQVTDTVATVPLFEASLALSLVTNAVSTILILYRLWAHLRSWRDAGLQRKLTSPVSKVMLVLVESGLVYCTIQALSLALFLAPFKPYSPADIAYNFITQMADVLTAMYPSIIVVLVASQRSMVEVFEFTTEFKNNAADRDPEKMVPGPELLGHLDMSELRTEDNSTTLHAQASRTISNVSNNPYGSAKPIAGLSSRRKAFMTRQN